MKTAIEQFTKGSTTISQTPKNLSKLEAPIFIFCPDPSFKRSFFKSHDIKSLGTEKYFWMDATLTNYLPNKFENHSALDLYMKMSHQYGSDWKIVLFDFRYVLHDFLSIVSNNVKLGVSPRVLDLLCGGYWLWAWIWEIANLQTCITEKSKVPNG